MSTISSTVSWLFASNHETRVILVGLDTAGKSTILYQLRLGECIRTTPTIGFNVEQVPFEGFSFTLWDIGGTFCLTTVVRHYYDNAKAVVYVVDTYDTSRMDLACAQLHAIVAADALRNTVILIYANKQDLQVMSNADVAEALRLRAIRQRWFVQPCCAVTGAGLHEGLHWIATALGAPSPTTTTSQ
ncbi:hypothetical protein SDRG_13507 [Saprolegnia diclina VS20]|uniref:ADP-ribosylation factor n=1 Tax=Saprolegnia diclina (strain VS20) TaxID=1156394 RepID=T0Q2N9_SAPDV|nr:hypothetical protein SDRG_13507 [Saprolegnia diclina VS20]EQC28826.1 hypothetical protein SDRG_13507 [Saprolegnia diclina VS20]|eukprot:XP_008617821.1 hypothetical protein SDRG_13507 [Saprolegnia diclina VS20]